MGPEAVHFYPLLHNTSLTEDIFSNTQNYQAKKNPVITLTDIDRFCMRHIENV